MFDSIKWSLLGTVLSEPRKNDRAYCETSYIAPDELYLFEQKDRFETADNIKHKLKLFYVINNISFIIYRCNKKLVIQSVGFLVQSDIPKFSLKINTNLSFESFHYGAKMQY